jgi:predicted aconitase with swiveling domain
MARTFKGRVLVPGNLEGKALVSKQPFNTTASYFTNMFAGNTKDAPCTDANNKELYQKDLSGAIICTPQTVGSTMGAGAIMGMNLLGVGFKAMLFSSHVDSIAAGGLIMDAVWNDRRSSPSICSATSSWRPSRRAIRSPSRRTARSWSVDPRGSGGLPSTGIPYVIVDGTVVVKDSKVVKGVFPGHPVRLPVKR